MGHGFHSYVTNNQRVYIYIPTVDQTVFPYIGNFIIPTDELIFFRGVGTPPTKKREMEHLEISMKYQLEAPAGMAITQTLR